MRISHTLLKGILCLLLVLSGCATKTVQYTGKYVTDRQIIATEKATQTEQTWKTEDIRLRYTVDSNGSDLLLKGHISLDSSISYTFPFVDSFNLYVYGLDEQGRVVDRYTSDIGYIRYSRFPDKCNFRLNIPNGTTLPSFAFGYYGTFTNASGPFTRPLDKEDRHISFVPLRD